jgi:hypothetical protein
MDLGIEKELGNNVYEKKKKKKPELIVSDNFTFERCSKKPQFSLAQSLFTHLNAQDI